MATFSEIVDFGVDWFTATATTKTAKKLLYNQGIEWMLDEAKHGNERRLWEFKGYSGFKAGGVQVGTRDDSSIVRVTGGLARSHFRKAYELGTNFSRLDQQVTIRTKSKPAGIIGQVYRDALMHSRKSARGPSVAILKHSNGSATVYLGQRVSENFGRVYDKGLESQLPVLEGCVRFELESKGARAMLHAKELARSGDLGATLVGNLQAFFRDRGCRQRFILADTQTIVLHRPRTDRARQLDWIRECVGPTVQKLINDGYSAELYDALHVQQITAAVQERRRIA